MERLEKKRILVVDDDKLHCRSVQRLFAQREEFEVWIVNSGSEALSLLSGRRPDLMLVDYSMPEMSGVELLRAISARGLEVPSIMVTGYPDVDELLAVQREGLIDYIIAKPFTSEHLLRSVDQVLSLRAMKAAVRDLKRDTRY